MESRATRWLKVKHTMCGLSIETQYRIQCRLFLQTSSSLRNFEALLFETAMNENTDYCIVSLPDSFPFLSLYRTETILTNSETRRVCKGCKYRTLARRFINLQQMTHTEQRHQHLITTPFLWSITSKCGG